MLLKMLPEQVSDRWDILKDGIEANLPPIVGEVPEKLNNILAAILSGEMQCWVSIRDEEGGIKSGVAILLTTTLEDKMSGTRSLLLYLVWAYAPSQASDWIEGFEGVQKFAKLMKCHRIITYTSEEKIINISEKFGGEMQTFISWPVYI